MPDISAHQTITLQDVVRRLLPTPKRIQPLPGAWQPHGQWKVENACNDSRVAREAQRILQQAADDAARRGDPRRPATPMVLALRLGEIEAAAPQGYSLRAEPRGVTISARDSAGCFYGLATLRQLICMSEPLLPCLRIDDAPSFATRGLLHDVTRGKVPRLDTLKRLVDRLASLKINQLQLYIEHAFTFAFDPDICDADHGLTLDEVRELDAYASERFITLVPALATLGHMGRVLSLPRYRHLAEIEAPAAWADLTWPQRARGFTLDVLNPESTDLVERLWGDVLAAFSSPTVNICGDEPHDLGRGKNATRLSPADRTAAYLRHIAQTVKLVRSAGRHAQMWSDVVVQHSDDAGRLPEDLPRDITFLHWGYDSASRYEMTTRFVNTGLNTVVCPGTTGWKRILNAIGLAERNIRDFAAAGASAGATGLLNTDWGDHGHFNLLGCSAHGIALGAACGWSGSAERGGADFDRRFARCVLRREDRCIMDDLRACAELADTHETWTLLRTPPAELTDASKLPSAERLHTALRAARRLAQAPVRGAPDDALSGHAEITDLKLAARMTELLAEKLLAIADRSEPFDGADWRERLADAQSEYGSRWLACNKRGGLNDIRNALARA